MAQYLERENLTLELFVSRILDDSMFNSERIIHNRFVSGIFNFKYFLMKIITEYNHLSHRPKKILNL